MAAPTSPATDLPHRTATTMSAEEAVPDSDPSSTAGLLAERLQAWKHAVGYLEEYMEAIEKVHHVQSKEYEKVLKTISKPLREGQHFDQSVGGVAGFFENMRANTQALIVTNAETEKSIKGSVLPILDRLHKEVKNKSKELAGGIGKGAKEVEKARNTTQKHIELLGQHAAAFESSGGKMTPSDDPYVIRRGVLYRLNRQIMEENNHRNDLLAVQANFKTFEAHVIQVIQQAMEAFNQFAGGQAERSRILFADMLGAVQQVPPDFEWKGFEVRNKDILISPNEPMRTVDAITFPNQEHPSTRALIEGSLERKSRNKLSWGYNAAYYVVTPSRYLHEFKDSDNFRKEPTPELSIYLPDAVIGMPNGEKFHIKGKDKSKTISSKLASMGGSELMFKAHTPADAQRWFEVIQNVCGATGPARADTGSTSPGASGSGSEEKVEKPAAAPAVDTTVPPATIAGHKEQEVGITGGDTVQSPTVVSPTDGKTVVPTAADDKKAEAAV